MPTNIYFFDQGTLNVDISGTTVPVADVRDISITPAAEHNRFYGPDSIEFKDVKRHSFQVNVDITAGQFDEQFLQYWLSGDSSTTSTTPTDDNNVAQFDLVADQPRSGGDHKIRAVVNQTDFPEMPAIAGTENEYNDLELTGGVGKTITFTNTTV